MEKEDQAVVVECPLHSIFFARVSGRPRLAFAHRKRAARQKFAPNARSIVQQFRWHLKRASIAICVAEFTCGVRERTRLLEPKKQLARAHSRFCEVKRKKQQKKSKKIFTH